MVGTKLHIPALQYRHVVGGWLQNALLLQSAPHVACGCARSTGWTLQAARSTAAIRVRIPPL